MNVRAIAASAGVLILAGTGLMASPAAAAPPSGPSEPGKLLQLSRSDDGPWADNLDSPLFGEVSPMAPGAAEETFWAFNTTGARASLSLSCTVQAVLPENVAPDSADAEELDDLAEALDLDYRVGSTGGFSGCGADRCSTDQLGGLNYEIGGRKARQVDVRLTFCGSGTSAMNQSASYSITVTLSQIPPKGGGKPQILGSQTLVAKPEVSDGASMESMTGTNSTPSSTNASSGGKSPVGKASQAKTTKVAATLPQEDGAVKESMPLIGGLLAVGALLAGFRRRRVEAD